MDRFDAMQAFVRVVETGSFTQAADTLHMGRSKVTQLVQQLEARLQVRLLHRTTRRVRATEDGVAYYERAVRVLADLDDAESSVSSAVARPRGRLRVDVPSPLASMVLVPALADFHRRYPDIRIDMGASDRMVDLVGENVDCVVRGGPPGDASLVARRIGELALGAWAAPSYLEQAGMPAVPGDLEHARHCTVGFVWSRSGRPFPYAMQRGDERVEVRSRHVFSVDDGHAYLAAALAGLGVVWLPQYMSREHARTGRLVALFEDWRCEPMPLYLALPPQRRVSARLRVFIAWLEEVLAVHAPLRADPLPDHSRSVSR